MQVFFSILFIYLLFAGFFGRGVAMASWWIVGLLAFAVVTTAYPVIWWFIGLFIIYLIAMVCYYAVTGKTPSPPPAKPRVQPPSNEEEVTINITVTSEAQKQIKAFLNNH